MAVILTTTNDVSGRPVTRYLGIATGEVIIGANIFRDMFSAVRDVVGGRAGSYEGAFRKARLQAFEELETEAAELGADAVIAISVDYETLGANGQMLMVSVTGTAVKLG